MIKVKTNNKKGYQTLEEGYQPHSKNGQTSNLKVKPPKGGTGEVQSKNQNSNNNTK